MIAPTIKDAEYVCDPRNISIKVEYLPQLGGIEVAFLLDYKPYLSLKYNFSPTSKDEDFDIFIYHICEMLFKNMTIDELGATLSANDYLKGRYLYKNLKAFYRKSGNLIWKK